MTKKLAVLGGAPIGDAKLPAYHNGYPIFGQPELDAVAEVVKSGEWGTGGPKQVEFEEKWAAFNDAKYAVMMTNGTHTLKLSMEALGIGPGDEVIVPGSTWQATASSVLDVNAIPILVDVDPDTYTIDPKRIEEAVTPRTRAIIPVHLYGRVCDMDAIMGIAQKYNLFVIEDCAHQHGSEWRGRKVGTIGVVGSYSLQATKILSTGEGGLCLTNNEDLYNRLYSLKFCGRPRLPKKEDPFLPTMQSGNFRANEFTAAIGIAQLARLPEANKIRLRNATYLEDAIAGEKLGISYLKRDPRVTFQAMYRLSFKYDEAAWDGVRRDTIIRAAKAELNDTFKFVKPYDPLNDSPLYRPYSKRTHKISPEYYEAINPARFHLPVLEKAFASEYLGIDHPYLLGEQKELNKVVETLLKLKRNIKELKEYEATL